MTNDVTGRYDNHATATHMRWAPDGPGGLRYSGIRIGYARSFCWIPYSEALTLADALVDLIETREQKDNE